MYEFTPIMSIKNFSGKWATRGNEIFEELAFKALVFGKLIFGGKYHNLKLFFLLNIKNFYA